MKGIKKLLLGLFLFAVVGVSTQVEAKAASSIALSTSELKVTLANPLDSSVITSGTVEVVVDGLVSSGDAGSFSFSGSKWDYTGGTDYDLGFTSVDEGSNVIIASNTSTLRDELRDLFGDLAYVDSGNCSITLLFDSTITGEYSDIVSGTIAVIKDSSKLKSFVTSKDATSATAAGIECTIYESGLHNSEKLLMLGDAVDYEATSSKLSDDELDHMFFGWVDSGNTYITGSGAGKTSMTLSGCTMGGTNDPVKLQTEFDSPSVTVDPPLVSSTLIAAGEQSEVRTVTISSKHGTWKVGEIDWTNTNGPGISVTGSGSTGTFRVDLSRYAGANGLKYLNAEIPKAKLNGSSFAKYSQKFEYKIVNPATTIKAVNFDPANGIVKTPTSISVVTDGEYSPSDVTYTVSGDDLPSNVFTPQAKGTYDVDVEIDMSGGGIEGYSGGILSKSVKYTVGQDPAQISFSPNPFAITVGSTISKLLPYISGVEESSAATTSITMVSSNTNEVKASGTTTVDKAFLTGLKVTADSKPQTVTMTSNGGEDKVTVWVYPDSSSVSAMGSDGSYVVTMPAAINTGDADTYVTKTSGALVQATTSDGRVYYYDGSAWTNASVANNNIGGLIISNTLGLATPVYCSGATVNGTVATMKLPKTAWTNLAEKMKSDELSGVGSGNVSSVTIMITPAGKLFSSGNIGTNPEAKFKTGFPLNVYRTGLDGSDGVTYTVDGTATSGYFYAVNGLTYKIGSSKKDGTFEKWEGGESTKADIDAYKATASKNLKAIYTSKTTPTPTATPTPTPTKTATPTSTPGGGSGSGGSSKDYDDVPKTGESKADIWILWAVLLVSILGAGFMVYKRFNLVNAIARVEAEEAIEEEARRVEEERIAKEQKLEMLKDLRNFK